jgi:predicted extracellular nuclease
MSLPLPRYSRSAPGRSRSRARRAQAVATGIVLAVTGLGGITAMPASADPAGTGLVVNEVYGGGGNSCATYTNDYAELFNPTGEAIDVSGWAVSYYSAKGNLGGTTALSGSVPAHGYYLVQESQGAGGSTPLPMPDASGQLALSATAGSVTLADAAGSVVDAVGFGTGSIVEDGDAPAPSNTTAVTRSTPGADTDDNHADFTTRQPAPVNAAGQTGTGDSGGDAGDVTIAQIQGTDTDTSPLVGKTATTEGVVTAVYAAGGFNGFYLETGGRSPSRSPRKRRSST